MPDTTDNISAPTKARPRRRLPQIQLPNGEVLVPRANFAMTTSAFPRRALSA